MSKNNRRTTAHVATARDTLPNAAAARGTALTFGEPEPIDRASLLDYAQLFRNGRWYEPPINLRGLANTMGTARHHASSLFLKRNLLVEAFVPTSYLSTREFSAFALDFVTFVNGYLQRADAISGHLLKLSRVPSMQTRVGLKPDDFWFAPEGGQPLQFDNGSIVHLFDVDVRQEIYGVPEYMSALHAVQLNRSATLFRRKYYDNGAHAGFILQMTDAAQDPADIDAIRQALKDSTGPGNFRNLFVYTPNGQKDGIRLIPISEVGARDHFASIKNTSRDDMLAAHRVPPQLLGVVPSNAGGFGDVTKAREAFVQTEIVAIEKRMLAVNEELGVEAIKFRDPAGMG
ncbi:phage portal protein [Luteibacter sp. 22Crub2.1]|uniref:phage portal protein n=1 Tax=Luteibacter sp. 22Crub2.1 TaxID=1283288 RepID=UPI0009C8710C|nr:phage portal protein [Luteibacter sp. 22Crub2.1]SKB69417.1 phage portal protein, PBSX family [Luteibacter sp. 22Crub2.1]